MFTLNSSPYCNGQVAVWDSMTIAEFQFHWINIATEDGIDAEDGKVLSTSRIEF